MILRDGPTVLGKKQHSVLCFVTSKHFEKPDLRSRRNSAPSLQECPDEYPSKLSEGKYHSHSPLYILITLELQTEKSPAGKMTKGCEIPVCP